MSNAKFTAKRVNSIPSPTLGSVQLKFKPFYLASQLATHSFGPPNSTARTEKRRHASYVARWMFMGLGGQGVRRSGSRVHSWGHDTY